MLMCMKLLLKKYIRLYVIQINFKLMSEIVCSYQKKYTAINQMIIIEQLLKIVF